MKQNLFVVLLIASLAACSSAPTSKATIPHNAIPVSSSAISTPQPTTTVTAATAPAAPQEVVVYSPYSTEGLLALNEFRSNNIALNDFLNRNRKPDYFFSGANTDFSYQKIYLVYLESDNLYLFDAGSSDAYKKFHPLPASMKEKFKNVIPKKPVIAANSPAPAATLPSQADISEADNRNTLEKSLSIKSPQPYLNAELLYAVPRAGMSGGENPLYPDLYFLDMPLNDLLENQYSVKYDSKKHSLKLIFPRSYEAGMLYKKPETETRKIFVVHSLVDGNELSLIVPDFLPGSDFYKTTHGNVSKAFSSLYQISVPQNFVDTNQLHMRYSIKLCQKDSLDYCAIKKGNAIYIRAIVIEATLYDNNARLPIESFVLK